MHFDLVFATDPRFPGGTSTSTAIEIETAAAADLSVGLLPFRSATLRKPRRYHPHLRARIEDGSVAVIDAETEASADLVLVQHATLFSHMPSRPVALAARAVAVVTNHPPRLGAAEPQYDVRAVLEAAERYFGAPAVIVPISPRTRQLVEEAGLPADKVPPDDWPRVVDAEAWAMPIRPPDPDRPIVVGRHARGAAEKWPDTADDILAAYPPDGCRVLVLGGPPPADRLPTIPPNWSLLAFDPAAPRRFLEAVDVWVYFHSAENAESFGMAPLEAMAAGKVVVLPPAFEPLFGDGAVYGTPADVRGLLAHYRADPAAYVIQAERARRVARERFSPAVWSAGHRVLRAFVGLPENVRTGSRPAVAVPPTLRTVLFVSSNGGGLGHITRLMAIAERLPASVRACFFTLSQGVGLVRERGFPVDFVPSHQGRGFADGVWSNAFAHEFAAALRYFRPDGVVFDGSTPYLGLIDVLTERPDIASIWIRRGLWRPGQNEEIPARQLVFDVVIEPGELAGREDVGATAEARDAVFAVDPIVLVDPADRLDRDAARATLDLPADGPIVLVQLGSGFDYDVGTMRTALIDSLARRGMAVVEVISPLAADPVATAADAGVLRRRVYPLARVAAAFDLVITEAGYNSFHELVLGGRPAVFIPRDGGGMDDQTLRARYAESIGLALALRARDLDRVEDVLDRALSPAYAARVAQRAARLSLGNGAAEAAGLIAETVSMIRADRPLAYAVAR